MQDLIVVIFAGLLKEALHSCMAIYNILGSTKPAKYPWIFEWSRKAESLVQYHKSTLAACSVEYCQNPNRHAPVALVLNRRTFHVKVLHEVRAIK